MANCGVSSTESELSRSKPSHFEVRQIGMSEYKQAAECLAEAFKKDEVARYMVDMNDEQKVLHGALYKLHLDMMRYITCAHVMKGLVTTIGPNYNAVALWMPPGKNIDDWWTMIRSGMWKLFFKLDKEGRTRCFKEFFPLLHETKERVLGKDQEAFYLVYLGTRPGSEKLGYGRKLVEHGAALADTAGLPTYLESSAAINVPFYEKSGFRFMKEVYLQRSGKPVSLGIMVREATIRKKTAASSLSKSSSNSSSVKGEKSEDELVVTTPCATAF